MVLQKIVLTLLKINIMIREIIKQEKEKKGLSVYMLAKLSKLQPTQIANYLKGKNDMTGSNLEKLFGVLNIKIVNPEQLTEY